MAEPTFASRDGFGAVGPWSKRSNLHLHSEHNEERRTIPAVLAWVAANSSCVHCPLSDPQGTSYVDPGVLAFDNYDGNLTDRVTAWGLSRVATNTPTPPGDPYIIQYFVADSAGNVSSPPPGLDL